MEEESMATKEGNCVDNVGMNRER